MSIKCLLIACVILIALNCVDCNYYHNVIRNLQQPNFDNVIPNQIGFSSYQSQFAKQQLTNQKKQLQVLMMDEEAAFYLEKLMKNFKINKKLQNFGFPSHVPKQTDKTVPVMLAIPKRRLLVELTRKVTRDATRRISNDDFPSVPNFPESVPFFPEDFPGSHEIPAMEERSFDEDFQEPLLESGLDYGQVYPTLPSLKTISKSSSRKNLSSKEKLISVPLVFYKNSANPRKVIRKKI